MGGELDVEFVSEKEGKTIRQFLGFSEETLGTVRKERSRDKSTATSFELMIALMSS